MLTCHNCGTSNPVHASFCQHCKMPGNLVPAEQKKTDQNPVTQTPQTTCVNCGYQTSDENDKCDHCNFPVLQNRSGNIVPNHLSILKLLRKTG